MNHNGIFSLSFPEAKTIIASGDIHGDLGEREWLDSDDVCRLLGISPRTLQTMRENGTLAYTKISHKVYLYQLEKVDTEKII